MEGRDMGDSDILQMTRVETNEKGLIQYRTTLPSGRDLTSEFMRPEDAKGKVMISWCDHVRQQIDVDAAEKEAIRKRGTLDEVEDVIAEAEPKTRPAESPLDILTARRDEARSAVDYIEQKIEALKQERTPLREELEQWEKAVESLRGETDG